MENIKPDQPILTISVAAQLLGLHPRTLMLYEKTGLLSPHKTSTKRRLYSLKDLEEIQFLKFLTQEKKINLAGVKVVLEGIRYSNTQNFNLQKVLFPDFRVRALL